MNWYYLDSGTQKGPITDADFGPLTQQGVITASTYLWCDGMADWKTYGELTGAAQPAAVATAVAAPAGGLRVTRDEAPSQPAQKDHTQIANLNYAPPPLRIVAWIVDALLIALFLWVSVLGMKWILTRTVSDSHTRGVIGVLFLVGLVLWIVDYFSGRVARNGGTMGQTLVGLKVVAANGGPISFLRALGRFLVFIVINQFTFSLGHLVAFFDPQKRCLHDMACGTVVLKR